MKEKDKVLPIKWKKKPLESGNFLYTRIVPGQNILIELYWDCSEYEFMVISWELEKYNNPTTGNEPLSCINICNIPFRSAQKLARDMKRIINRTCENGDKVCSVAYIWPRWRELNFKNEYLLDTFLCKIGFTIY